MLSGYPGVLAQGGYLYISDPDNNRIRRVNAAGIIETVYASSTPVSLRSANSVAADAAGNVYVSDIDAHVVWRRSGTGVLTIGLAGRGTAARPPDRRSGCRAGWRWTPPATCTSRTAAIIACMS